jgi:hypothetical protein
MKKTLYVHRPLLNGNDIIKWAKQQGFKKTLLPSDMHVTIAFSKNSVDWKQFTPKNTRITIEVNDSIIKPLGDEGAVVLKFDSNILQKRWAEFRKGGASWDWPEYQPHVSISYNGNGLDLKKMKPYRGKLIFGPEIFKEVDLGWKDKVKEK